MNFNVFNMAIAQHFENVDSAINYLVGLHKDDVDIMDKKTFNAVMKRYGLNDDGFESERDYIMSEVKRRIA